MLDLPRPAPADVFPLVRRITLDGVVPWVQMLRVTSHVEGLHEQGARVVAGMSESLAAVRELFLSAADIRQNERFERSHELVEPILAGFPAGL